MSLFSNLTKGLKTFKIGALPKIGQTPALNNFYKIQPKPFLINPLIAQFNHLTLTSPIVQTQRHASNLAPRRRKHKKAQKGRVPVRTGGSQKGNFVAFGDYGIRVKEGLRISASILTACHNVIKRKVKPAKGTKIWMRVFPDIPVSSKGNEARMGKGKGGFEYWACRVPKDKILFEIAGPNLPLELAKEAFRLASDCLPVKSQFVDKTKDPLKIKLAEMEAAQAQIPTQPDSQTLPLDTLTPAKPISPSASN